MLSDLQEMNKLLIVGTVAFDSIETPFGKIDQTLGGAGTYIGLSASNFQIETAIVSVVGNDFPAEYIDWFKQRKINVEGIEVVPNGKTFFWSGKYHNDLNSRDTLQTDLNVLENFKPIVPQNFRKPNVVMLGNLHPMVQIEVLKQLENKPKWVILDTMNYWMNNTLNELKQVLRQVDIITINDEEARQLSGEYSLVKAAQKIQQMGPKYIIIKKGEHGALLFHDEKVFFAPALPLEEVFDPTGAGDTFAGGVAGYLTEQEETDFEQLKNAIIFGSNLASFCVEKFGTERMLEISAEEINQRLNQFQQLTKFDTTLRK